MISWMFLLIGGLSEVGFVAMMKLSNGFKNLKYSILTILCMAVSFYSLSHALITIPVGIGYSIWSGIGAVGSVLVGMFFFKESKDTKKLLLVSLVLISIAGLKLSTM